MANQMGDESEKVETYIHRIFDASSLESAQHHQTECLKLIKKTIEKHKKKHKPSGENSGHISLGFGLTIQLYKHLECMSYTHCMFFGNHKAPVRSEHIR